MLQKDVSKNKVQGLQIKGPVEVGTEADPMKQATSGRVTHGVWNNTVCAWVRKQEKQRLWEKKKKKDQA